MSPSSTSPNSIEQSTRRISFMGQAGSLFSDRPAFDPIPMVPVGRELRQEA